MSQQVLFQMWGPFRQSLIESHMFYVEQAKKRLLSQFDDIESEADKASEAWLEQNSHRFNPDFHDPADFEERAYDAGIEFYQLLSDMRDTTRFSVVAGMYHEWDKRFRQWLVDETRHWHTGAAVQAELWKKDFGKLAFLMESFDWKVRDKDYFPLLDACRLVVNVYKHGEGKSLNDLKARYPEYLDDPFYKVTDQMPDFDYLDHSHLSVSDEQLEEFSEAIIAFWQDVPENIFYSENISIPIWFQRALKSNGDADK